MKNEQLTPYLKNAIDLQRYGNKLGGDVVAVYTRAARTLLDDFAAAGGSTEERMARLQAQASQIKDTVASAYGDQYPDLLNQLTQLANQQTKFNAKALKSAAGVGVSVRSVAVSPEYVQALAAGDIDLKLKMSGGEIIRRSLPRILPDDQPSLNAAIADLANSSSKVLANTLRSELLLGKTNDEIVRGLLNGNRIPKGSPLKKTERAIRAVVRSAVIGTASEAQMLTIEANRDITTQYEFVATLDSRTTLICMTLDGKVYSVDDGSAPRPPIHMGCLLGDTHVLPIGGVSFYSMRPFNGDIFTIRTAGGYQLSVTPNHPVLTDRGFVAANLINKGDKVVTQLSSDFPFPPHPYDDNVIPTIKERIDTLYTSGEVVAVPMPTSAEDFHGDVSNDDISIVFIDSHLCDSQLPSISQHLVQNFLKGGRVDSLSAESTASAFTGFLFGLYSSTSGMVGSLNEPSYFFRRRIGHSCLLLLRSITGLDVPSFQYASNDIGGVPKFSGNSGDPASAVKKGNHFSNLAFGEGDRPVRLPSRDSQLLGNPANMSLTATEHLADFLVCKPFIEKLDEVVGVSVERKFTHVYNLETQSGVYCSNSIVTHNCRSTTVPYLGDLSSGGTRASAKGQVDSDLNYEQWLRQQPDAYQDEALGRGKASLFRNGMGLSQMVREDGSVLTIEQLRGDRQSSSRQDPLARRQGIEEEYNNLLNERTKLLSDSKYIESIGGKASAKERLSKIKEEFARLKKENQKIKEESDPSARIQAITKQIDGLISERTKLLTNPAYIESIGGKDAAKKRLGEIKEEKERLIQEGKDLKPKINNLEEEPEALKKFKETKAKGAALIESARQRLSAKDQEFMKEADAAAGEFFSLQQERFLLRVRERGDNEPDSIAATNELEKNWDKFFKAKLQYEEQKTKRESLLEKQYESTLRDIRRNHGVTKADAKKAVKGIINETTYKDAEDYLVELYQLAPNKFSGLKKIVQVDDRGHANERSGDLNIGGTLSKEIFYHEVGHFIEYGSPYLEPSFAFVRNRAIGNQKKLLSELTGDASYGDEAAWEDKFTTPYVGKTYANATEVISVGLEHIANKESFYNLMESDREHLEYVLGVLAE